ncbi:MAG: hypothetical protein IKE02_06605 [Lachnospiraceae bacterium]|nr:hypothetical protein [Lachnospiraceae bacterium]
MKLKKLSALLIAGILTVSITACGSSSGTSDADNNMTATSSNTISEIESALDISKNNEITWTYDSQSDSWTMSITSAVTDPEIEDDQGVSVNVPGAYVKGLDTDGDGKADVTAKDADGETVGVLIVDEEGSITNGNGQTYTATSSPVIINTGAAGYSEQQNQLASSQNAANGYINVACGNRGKQSTAEDEDGNEYYTGDAPLCLVDQKNAIRFVKYNILLGNLPGNVDYFVSTGGSGGGAHAAMVAATSNNESYYDYEIEAGAVGVYRNEDGSYSTTVTIDGKDYDLSDGVWGCVAYSAITSLAEADMTMAFEYYLDTDYSFSTNFQKQLASYLSEEYMNYINDQNLSVKEAAVGYDLNGDGDQNDNIELTIEYDKEKYAETNGYGGSYLDLYLAEFQANLEEYLADLDYAGDWTWFNADGEALSDEEVAAMTTEDKAQAFIKGLYAKGSSSEQMGPGGAGGGMPGGEAGSGDAGGPPDMNSGEAPSGEAPSGAPGGQDATGGPDAGTTQAAGNSTDSSNYESYEDMLASYEEDIASIEEGDKYGNNIVELYDPLTAIGADTTDNPTWTRIVMGASEGDMSMFSSLNLQLAWLNAGTDAVIEWQWDGGHVPSEIFGDSLSLYIDQMYGKYVDGATEIEKAEAEKQAKNGDATEATGTDISSWVNYSSGSVTFSLADAASYRTNSASKAIPGFDVIDYGQETYEFGSSEQDARHFDKYVLKALQDHADELKTLFNQTD